MSGAVISSDHGSDHAPSFSTPSSTSSPFSPPTYTRSQIEDNNASHTHQASPARFLAVIDGYVVDASEYARPSVHPGGVKKASTTNDESTGATGEWGGFSFTKGRNAHFPGTEKRWKEGVEEWLKGGDGEVKFEGKGKGRIWIKGIFVEG